MESVAIGVNKSRIACISGGSSLVSMGLARILEECGFLVSSVQEATFEEVPRLVVVCTNNLKDLRTRIDNALRLAPNTRVLVCGSCLDPALACAALQAGARGFIHAGMTPEQTARAIEVVMDGGLAAPRQLLGYLIEREEERKVKTDLHTLSKRQRETLDLVAESLTNSQIANKLFVSESTVKQRLGNIYKILGISSRTDAVKLLYDAERVSS